MLHETAADHKLLPSLWEEDLRIALLAQAAGCPFCPGRLDRADYPRKPRGGEGILDGDPDRRISLCCAREGCRRRVTPPSLVFLGRRVYLGIVVLRACLRAVIETGTRKEPPPNRTVNRWRTWFQTIFPQTAFFKEARGRIMPPIEDTATLPGALVERFESGRTMEKALAATLRFLAPITTTSMVDGARFVREACRHAELGT